MRPAPIDRDLIELLRRRGFERVETAILQRADLFLDLSGEDIRRRLFLTQDGAGQEFCLRPEHTIPVCLHHLRSAREVADYCYLGPVFRQRGGESAEFLQAGLESFGRPDCDEADADILALALEVLALFPAMDWTVTIGDMGLVEAVLSALDTPPAERRRLIRRLSAGRSFDEILAPETREGGPDYAGLLAAIEGQDPRAARSFVEDVISIAGIARVGGRSAGEIAERFLARAANRSAGLSEGDRAVLAQYLRIAGPAEEALGAIGRLATEAGLDISAATERFRNRLDLLDRRGVEIGRLRFSAGFARNFDYYTGFVFDVRAPGEGSDRVLAAGGRYDGLIRHLGQAEASPAVGCSFWLDRLGAPAALAPPPDPHPMSPAP